MELIVGRAQHQRGEIRLGTCEISDMQIHRRALLGIGYVPQQREVFPSLTVREHLAIAARPGRWDERVLFDLFPALGNRSGALGKHLSGGEQQMLAIARALVGNPHLLLMDEPSEGLAPVVVEQLVTAIREVVAATSLTVLLVEQRADIALDLSTRCMIMDRGNLVFEGESEALREDATRLGQLMGLDAEQPEDPSGRRFLANRH
jgi:branched-chain amino acid transport system ATP-binding protein